MNLPPARTGYAPVNGLNMFYRIQGEGQPLILIHGGFGVVEMFDQLVPGLAAGRQVIAVELQAHGRTADIDRPFSREQFGDDVAALIRHLGLGQADVLGFSLGGMVAMQTAIRHAEVVRKLVVVSSVGKSDGWYPEVRAAMHGVNAEIMTGSIPHTAYLAVAPDPAGFTALADKTRALMLGPDFDLSDGLAALAMPTLLMFGDADSIRPAHILELFGLLGGGQGDPGWDAAPAARQLAILPGTTHYAILDRVELVLAAVVPFLDAPLPAAAEAERG
ncbi:MAG TPA: alpha/beta fold hydrolase [Herpetosiphonaceae bacterium]|nr:alpha/beta fold hydrolase [Herpetosiphonaceae bacterium]